MSKFKLFRNGKRFGFMYFGMSILSLAIVLFLFISAKTTLETDIKEKSRLDITTFSNIFLDEISQLSTDIFLITDLLNVHDSLVINNDGETEFITASNREIIETEFLVWLGMKETYDQIRILDNTGMEIARANYNSGSPYIVEEDDLQDKAGRYYFTDAIILNDRDLYMSVLDLNVENGEIELVDGVPKPMLRVATPLFNTDGVKLGVVLVNYLVEDLFEKLDSNETTNTNSIEIINEDGYYLYAEDEAIEFAFMYDLLSEETFSKYHDFNIFSTPNGEIISSYDSNEFYTSIRLTGTELTDAANNSGNDDLNIEFGSKEFIIFTELDISENAAYQNTKTLYIVIGIVTLFITLIISRLIDESIYLREENLKRMVYDSTHDSLTSLPNRKNIYEQIQYQINRKRKFTILFIDFDGFKNVNDQFGHDIGDEALVQGSLRIKNAIRLDDILARIGGDEFIVFLRDLEDSAIASRICESIIAAFSDDFDLSGNIAKMGVSIGAYINSDSHLDLEAIISKSDKAMYQVKHSGKNNYLIFNDIDDEK